jgi:3HB-oligomer hydrolase (3HBOH)/Tannase and feruloyl esterase
MDSSLRLRCFGAAVLAALTINPLQVARGAPAALSRCDQLLSSLGGKLSDASCVESADLTTANPATTPADNSIASLPKFAFTPQTDRNTIAPAAPDRTPITAAVPGLQINARMADDPQGQARILIRLPDNWNGRLVVVGAPGTRSEFNGDFAWSDYAVQKGYAYVAQNKGILNAREAPSATDPTACRLNPASTFFVEFYDDDAGMPFSRWATFMAKASELGRAAVATQYGRAAQYTYAVGTSNGGYQVRRAVESYPELFDGGVDWEGTFVDPEAPNLLTTLPPAILNFPEYLAFGLTPLSTAAKNILAAGYPPDLINPLATPPSLPSFWQTHYLQFWEVTMCQWQKRVDPAYDTYGGGLGNYVYVDRLSQSDVGQSVADFATTGRIQRPLITLAGTMDALLPIDTNARAYARRVAAAAREAGNSAPAYRLYEVQNGNHIETFRVNFPQLELIQPHALRAFDLLVDAIENKAELPPSQCIPRGGKIETSPTQPSHCKDLFVP